MNRQGRAAPADIAGYPADVSFVITQLLQHNAPGASGPLRGRIDAEHIGAGGISLGGMTGYGLISNTCCEDHRIDAAILMSAVRPDFPQGR